MTISTSNCSYKKVKGIKRKPAPDKTYNIATANHNYFADGVLVHNCDDPNDPQKTDSPVVRDATERKFRDYSVGRRSDPKNTGVIVIQQRCNVADITGYIEQELKDKYTFFIIPTRAEKHEEVRSPLTGEILATRQPGQLMHPDRFGEEEDAEALRTLGAYMYASRHQQQPYAKGGGIFSSDWWCYFDEIPKNAIAVISVDASFGSVTDTASYVVIQQWLVKRPNFLIYDQFRSRLTYPETEKKLKECRAKWQQELDQPIAAMLIEGKANGKAIIQTLRSRFNGIIEIIPTESKKSRAEAAAPSYQSGNVLLRRGGGFIPIFQLEHERFPNYSSDDCVDGASQLINYYQNRWRIEDMADEGITIKVKKY